MLNKTITAICFCLLSLCVLLVNAGVTRAEEMKIGILDVQRVLDECDAGKTAKTKLEGRMKELQAKFKTEEEELKELQKEIEKKSSAWSEETKQVKVRELQKKRREAQAKVEDARFEMKGLEKEHLAPILSALKEVVQKYGETNGYTVILDAKAGVVYSAGSVDISDKIIVELNAVMANK